MSAEASLKEQFLQTPRLDACPIYDMHGHMGPLQGARLPRCSPEDMVASMQRAGVKLIVFCHHAALFTPEFGNALNIRAVRRFPDRFRAYCGINPNYVDQAKIDVDTFAEHRDVYVGFKFLADYHRFPITHERYQRAWETADRYRTLVLLHTWGGSSMDGPELVEEVAKNYPNAIILMGHSCHGQWAEAARLAREFPNVYLELTAVLDDRGAVELFVRETGSEKILFGTDSPWFNHHYYVGALLGAEMTDEDRRNILFRNAQRLLRPLM